MGELPALAKLGVTVLEIMPIADFSGRFGWGYDGVVCLPHPSLRHARRLPSFIDRAILWG